MKNLYFRGFDSLHAGGIVDELFREFDGRPKGNALVCRWTARHL